MEAVEAVDLDAISPEVRAAVLRDFVSPWAVFILVMLPVDLVLVAFAAGKSMGLLSFCG